VEIVESMGGMDEAVNAARGAASSGDAFLPDQFSNPANPEAHRLGTGPEILKAMDDKVDIFVAGVGTGGTITGVGEVVKSVNPRAQIIAVEPASSAVLTGRGPGPHRIQGIGAGFVPAVLDREIIDEVIPVSDDDAIATAHLAAAREGVLAGISCGAALWGAIEVGKRPENQGKRIVAILPDSGERYISAPFFAPQ
jgi:cysteine synthase A